VDPISFAFWRFYYFFREPIRRPPAGRVVLAPADGVILYRREVRGGATPSPIKQSQPVPLDEWIGTVTLPSEGVLVGIYMTPLSVHFNRAPVAGRISRVVARPAVGENLSMTRTFMRLIWRLEPYEEDSRYVTQNARNSLVFEGEVPMAMVQIADRYVSQIDCFVRQGDIVKAGDKVGMIRMGSQCDLYIPYSSNVTLTCRPGERVYAGESILGTY
jgi:phosphatidylserine decarboxylase